MSTDEIDRLRRNQKEIEQKINDYMEKNKENLDEFLKRTHGQYRAYIIGQIELLQGQIKSAIMTGNDMMVAFNKALIDAWFGMLGHKV